MLKKDFNFNLKACDYKIMQTYDLLLDNRSLLGPTIVLLDYHFSSSITSVCLIVFCKIDTL